MVNEVRNQKAIKLLKALLAIPSVNGVDDEGKLARYIHEYFVSNGICSKLYEIDKMHSNVIASIEGETKETVVWNGHLDTVPYGSLSDWNKFPDIPYEESGKIYARGTSDMKSGLAGMIFAMTELKRSGRKPHKTIYFIGTSDEEKDGIGATHIVNQGLMPQAELLLIGEPTGLQLGVAQKGCLWINLKVEGQASHGAYPGEGANAIEYAFHVASEFKRTIERFSHPILGNATVQVTQISGGMAPNVTPDRAELVIDIRTLPELSADKVLEMLVTVCQNYHRVAQGKVRFQYQLLNDRGAIQADGENKWIALFQSVLEKNQLSAEKVGINYFTDASILAKSGAEIPVLLFGPGEPAQAHKANEYVEISKFLTYIELLINIFMTK